MASPFASSCLRRSLPPLPGGVRAAYSRWLNFKPSGILCIDRDQRASAFCCDQLSEVGERPRQPVDLFEAAESGSFVASGCQPSGIASANVARVGDMPTSSSRFGRGVALSFLLEAPFLTAFSPKKRCPFQFVPVIALATCERLR